VISGSAAPGRPLRVVALGGGHGLSASLSALRLVTDHLTAVVTVADDGGSSGRLRAAYDLLPPGDLRMALTTLAADTPQTTLLREVFQFRFPPGRDNHGAYAELTGHPVGNLLLAGLMLHTDDPIGALDTVGQLLGLPEHTRVLPMSREPLDIAAQVRGLESLDGTDSLVTVRGQVEVATTRGRVLSVHLLPANPPACPEAIAAVEQADAIVLGPGSLFTSVLPHLLLPELRKAITASAATRVLVLNLVAQPGETDGFSPESHLEVIGALVPELTFDWVVAHAPEQRPWFDEVPGQAPEDRRDASHVRRAGDQVVSEERVKRGLIGDLHVAADALGARVHLAPIARTDSPGVHDTAALAQALRSVLVNG
jgi:uncharacterized cofD-like protein